MDHSNVSCSFCGKHQKDVEKIIAGPTVYICNECVGLCTDIIAEERAIDTTARGSGKLIAAQPEDTMSVLAFVQQHCDRQPMDTVTVGELVTKRRMLSAPYIARLHREREERVRTIAREDAARRGFEYANLDAICADAVGLQRIHTAIQQLKVDRQWCTQHHALPLVLVSDHLTGGYTVVSPQPEPGEQYEAVFRARIRARYMLGAAPFDIQYCDPDAFDRALDLVFGTA